MNYPLTLEQYIAQMPMQEAELARMGAQIAEALSVIHQQGRVHGDVKPGNILVVSPGNYQLIGYESVRQYPEGTIPTFVAPELTQGGAYHAGTDVYALGMLMKSLIPKQGISGVFDEIIQKACEPDPARRYATALEFAEELQMLADVLEQPMIGAGQQMYVQTPEQPPMQPTYVQTPEQPPMQPSPVQQPRRQSPAQQPTDLVNHRRNVQQADAYNTQEEMHLQPKKRKSDKGNAEGVLDVAVFTAKF